MIGLAGVTEMEDRVAEFTVRVVLPEILPEAAVRVAVPIERAVARPLLLSTVATDALSELQVTCVVISKIVVSKYVPWAVNGWVASTGMPGLAGVKEIKDRVSAFTVRVVVPAILPEAAAMVTVPIERAVARPLLLIVATNVWDELQATCVVILWLVPSEYVPVAVNCWVTPTGTLGLTGVTDIEDRVAGVTVRMVLPMEPPFMEPLHVTEVAVMVVVPTEMAMARPLLLTVATDVFDELQVTSMVISRIVVSLK